MGKKKWVRDVVYGFIGLDEQECAIVNHPSFQRLRRIKQLALTGMVYPGANHTRFEHSLGVMQMASDMYTNIVEGNQHLIESRLKIDKDGILRFEKIVRLAALLHDVGHPPFSHSGEDLLPEKEDGSRYRHEDYSIAAIKNDFREIIETMGNFRITTGDVYLHKVRRIYDYHISRSVREILNDMGFLSVYPSPSSIGDYLKFDDWEIYGALKKGLGGKHGKIILERKHYKCEYETKDPPTEDDIQCLIALQKRYPDGYLDNKEAKFWYQLTQDIKILAKDGCLDSLAEKSRVIQAMNIKPQIQRFYMPRKNEEGLLWH
ncbi:MAG: HD domain-containing protein [Clostridiales bacterium]|nr:HD domain-containing protein [Clostridiales bacterium]